MMNCGIVTVTTWYYSPVVILSRNRALWAFSHNQNPPKTKHPRRIHKLGLGGVKFESSNKQHFRIAIISFFYSTDIKINFAFLSSCFLYLFADRVGGKSLSEMGKCSRIKILYLVCSKSLISYMSRWFWVYCNAGIYKLINWWLRQGKSCCVICDSSLTLVAIFSTRRNCTCALYTIGLLVRSVL